MTAPVTEAAGVAPRTVVHTAAVAAPAGLCFDLVAQVERAPQFFATHLHAEVAVGDDGRESVERWVLLPGGAVRHWTAGRVVDGEARRIVFEHAGGRPPLAGMRGEWTFTAQEGVSDGSGAGGLTTVRLEHTLSFADGTSATEAERAVADIDRGGPAQLAQLREVAESHGRLTGRTVRASARALVPGASAADVHERLADAVDAHGAGWAVARVADRALVLKRVPGPDDRLGAVTARLDLGQAPEGVQVTLSAAVTAAETGPSPAALGRRLPAVVNRALLRLTEAAQAPRTA
ncbi:Polyketide cyclase / dehydrase and lipid transport [Streptomyces sp. cf386]|uniref:SRPBCC family protein n=1 Tax=Streptomyces sp. cf386 TaxID=1761904 RepID=UPI00089055C6|nr:SRPBCC family protein [Streptomyces sp. cf386]SDP01205.1 Polyketide cyclase / dehydrase and lipid transport [Streptomyces sp. cf386]